MNNIITIAGDNDVEKKKKGGGTNAILTLMKELGDFQNKVESCIDAQDISDRKQKLEIFYDKLDEMAEILLEMASDGIKSKRKVEVLDESTEKNNSIEDKLESFVNSKPMSGSRVQLVNVPSIPRLPR